MSNTANLDHYHALARVVTLAEASRITYRDPKSVKYAIQAGNIAALKCGRVWLVSVDSLLEHFPKPEKMSA